jgi:hypothetical protein
MTRVNLRLAFAAALCAAVLTVPLVAGTKFTTTWKAPGIAGRTLSGQKIAVVAITDDQSLRMSAEEAMARALTAQGVTGEASYRLIPIEELKDRAKAKAWFERRGVKSVVTLRLLSVDKARSVTPVVWTTYSYYGSFYDYYAWGWSDPSLMRVTEETTVALELLVFSIQDGGLGWAGTCETTDPPKDPDKFAKSVVDEAVKQMQKQGLLAKKK